MKAYRFKYAGRPRNVFPFEILKIEAAENYSIIHLKEGKSMIIAKTLKRFEEELENVFFRINRKLLINIDSIDSQEGNQLKLNNGQSHRISRRRILGFENIIKKAV
ncbi:MAG: LytTR family DNA-binding domain-containing protein [Spirosomataceae bacterium]|jgi:two-component system LytT family response regulator|nr:LytTR family transcriptional regulator [Bacteroidota bacterium]